MRKRNKYGKSGPELAEERKRPAAIDKSTSPAASLHRYRPDSEQLERFRKCLDHIRRQQIRDFLTFKLPILELRAEAAIANFGTELAMRGRRRAHVYRALRAAIALSKEAHERLVHQTAEARSEESNLQIDPVERKPVDLLARFLRGEKDRQFVHHTRSKKTTKRPR